MIIGTPEKFDSRDLDADEPDEHALNHELYENCDERPSNGIQCIREDNWVAYVEELIEECYPESVVPKNQQGNWPYRHITYDYEAAAEELKEDYYETEFRGETYYCR